MSYQVSRSSMGIVSGTGLLGIYLFQAMGRVQTGGVLMHDMQAWAQLMLTFIGIAIAAGIVLEIVFHILYSIGVAVRESIANGEYREAKVTSSIEQDMVEDEMARLIGLKSLRVAYVITTIGILAALFSLALGYPAFIMLNILFVAFFIAGIADGCTRLYFHHRGL